MSENSVFSNLMSVLEDRKRQPKAGSYTNTLFAGGVAKIGQKVIEEAAESVSAAEEPGEEGRQHLIHEAADVIYHVFVLLAFRGVALSDVEAELNRRVGVSGLEEKASRKAAGDSSE